jgi:catechol 2,3-dioxygenase-like lactoylglutathione lyase family enzyme
VCEDPHGSAHNQSFGEGAEDFPHATRGRFEAVESSAVSDAEFPGPARQRRCGLTGLALEVLDVLLATVAGVADEGVDVFMGQVYPTVVSKNC